MAYNFHIQTMVQVSDLITTIHTCEVTLYHHSEYSVKHNYTIFNIDSTSGERKSEYTHREVISDNIYESLWEAENAYHVTCVKAFTKINTIDKASDLTKLQSERIMGLPF